ncbi:MAG: hypothetical protein GTO18_11120 [Anaerolineales bacterium]|nr:hypothetical protein [Anaerolineales bacterium]
MAMYRAWRFLHPDLSAVEELGGLGFAGRGGVDMVEDEAAIRQAIFLLLSTRPGERVMRPDYGCRIHQLIFSPNDDTTAGLAIHYVRRALERWEPRIDIIHLDAERHESTPEQLVISLNYRVRRSQRVESMEFPLNLAGEEV